MPEKLSALWERSVGLLTARLSLSSAMAPERNPAVLMRQIHDYTAVTKRLLMQRLTIYSAALILAAFYYSVAVAIASGVLVIISEIFDYVVADKIIAIGEDRSENISWYLALIHIGVFLNAGVIIFYTVSIALIQGPTTHFLPLFFLFAAALFAAMNSHQIVSVLMVRLSLYGSIFLSIPIWDIYITSAPLTSDLWAQLFTSIFVLYFIIDCSVVYFRLYQKNLLQMEILRRDNERTRAVSETKTQFLATVSHELRTPLTSIKGSLDLANSGALGELPEGFSRLLEIAQSNANRLNVLIDDLLDQQSMEAGQMKYDFKPVQLSNFIHRVLSVNRPFAGKFDIKLHYTPVDDDIFVKADPERLEQVLSNILSNAIKFSEAGSEIQVSVDVGPERVRMKVKDSGVGLSDLDHDLVFDRFSQVDSSDRRKVGGTGLGMDISRRIVEAHGGTIDYYANNERGTTFFVDLARLDHQA
ncbi:sensor histidine kinase [Pontibaca salina]|uniref:histidine kinase n=1 Tax=Pontibaca salina TaxID=2795731 RepID=A0A934HIH0_9RHOB|nr:HAMP domain-containing sensor histidine kinase [Pontibaca salina]MBI6628774.1 HAMP domain-containing histidine kinase [Pontibaca salina]